MTTQRQRGRYVNDGKRRSNWVVWAAALVAVAALVVMGIFVFGGKTEVVPSGGEATIYAGDVISVDLTVYGYESNLVVRYNGDTAGFDLLESPGPQRDTPDELVMQIVGVINSKVTQLMIWDGTFMILVHKRPGDTSARIQAFQAPLTITR